MGGSPRHGSAHQIYTPSAVVIRASADGFEPAKSFIAAELGTLQTKPDISLRPVSADRDGKVIHHIFKTCTTGLQCGNGYFRLENVNGDVWKIATDVWTLTPYEAPPVK